MSPSPLQRALARAAKVYTLEVAYSRGSETTRYLREAVRTSPRLQQQLRKDLCDQHWDDQRHGPIIGSSLAPIFDHPLASIPPTTNHKPDDTLANLETTLTNTPFTRTLMCHLGQQPARPLASQLYDSLLNSVPIMVVLAQRHHLFAAASLKGVDRELEYLKRQIEPFHRAFTLREVEHIGLLTEAIASCEHDVASDPLLRILDPEFRFYSLKTKPHHLSTPEEFASARDPVWAPTSFFKRFPWNVTFNRFHLGLLKKADADTHELFNAIEEVSNDPKSHIDVVAARVSTTHPLTAKFFEEELPPQLSPVLSYNQLLELIKLPSPVAHSVRHLGYLGLTEVSEGPGCVYLTRN